VAVEDAARFRDALGAPLPPGIPESLLQPVADPIGDLALRYARTHAPFNASDFASRFGLTTAASEAVLQRLAVQGRLVEGEFRPCGTRREWTDAGVLRMLRHRSLARLRHEIEPVEQSVLGRFATTWQGVVKRRRGADALLDAIEQLQGAPLPASILETEILPARVGVYDPGDLDAVTAAGEGGWVGSPAGAGGSGGASSRGASTTAASLCISRITCRLLPRSTGEAVEKGSREAALLEVLADGGAAFFGPLHEAVGGGYPAETVE